MQTKLNLEFKKSSFSDDRSIKSRCVEVSINSDKVLVRHSRDHALVLEFDHGEWEAFLLGVKNQEFDLPKED
jgi:hypothetical protein